MSASKNKGILMREVLQNKDMFDLFALHLAKEFGIESLLFLYEAMAFKNQCLLNGLLDNNDDADNCGITLEFDNSVKRVNSDIIDMNSFYYNLKYMVMRYISV